MFKKVKESKDDKERHERCQEDPKQNFSDKNISLVKNTVAGIHTRLDTAEEKISEPEDRAIKTILNETQRRKKSQNTNNRVSVSCGVISTFYIAFTLF